MVAAAENERFLGAPTGQAPARPSALPAPIGAPRQEGPGSRIGPYKLLQLIGEGGFGSVFMAEQEKPVARRVALKVIKLGMDTRQVVARFEQERQALAILDHPNIAKVFDAGATETGRPFFVMELCKGDAIVEYCDKNNLSVDERLELFAQVCTAVQHAHTKGIIHRDIKPSNVLVSTQDGRPQAKVIDFGIAKATASTLTERTLFTERGQFIGTPEYMSPEQAEGSLDIDTRTDVYSLGVLLYELLTGTTPLVAKELRCAAFAEIQRIIREVEPPKPSTRLSRNTETLASVAAHRHTEPRKLGTIIRGDLDWIVMKALEKDRSRRYETPNSFAMDIQRHLKDEPVEAGPPSTANRVRKFIRRYRWQLAANALTAALTIAGLIGTTSALMWALKEKDRANEETRKAEGMTDLAEREAYHAQLLAATDAIEEQRSEAARALLEATPVRLRGWEHRHLVSRLDWSLPSPLPEHLTVTGFVEAASAGLVLVRGTLDDGTHGWVAFDREWRPARLVLHGAVGVFPGSISPDGRRVLAVEPATADRRGVALLDSACGEVIARIPEPRPGAVLDGLDWDPSGERFIVGYGTFLGLHDGRTAKVLQSVEMQGARPCFVADGRYIVMNGAEGVHTALRLLDARSLEPMGGVFNLETAGAIVGIWVRGSRIAIGTDFGNVHLIEVADGRLQQRWAARRSATQIRSLSWSHDGRLVATSDIHGHIFVQEVETGALRAEFSRPTPVSVLFLESGDLLAAEQQGWHRVLPIATGSMTVLEDHRGYVYPGVFSHDGGMLLTAGWDGAEGHAGGLKIWGARTGALVGEYGQPGEIFYSADLTPDGRYAVAGVLKDWAVAHPRVIDLSTGTVFMCTECPAGAGLRIRSPPERMIVHPDGRRVLSAHRAGEAFVWDLRSGRVLWSTDQHNVLDHAAAHGAAAVSPDGRFFALVDADIGIRLIDAQTYQDVRRWEAHTEYIWSLSFTPDRKRLVSTSDDDTVGLWDVETGAPIARLVGHGADVLCAAMSPDGTRIATGGRDGYVRLWDTTHFDNVAQLGGHTSYIYSLAWSPDGQQLVSTSGDTTVRVWDTRTLAERVEALRLRRGALPGIEATVARAWHNAADPAAAIESLVASTALDRRERELVRQVVAGYTLNGGVPAYYRAPRASEPIVIDGRIDEGAWSAAPWTPLFGDIEGAKRTTPRFETRARMLWDDRYHYVAAYLAEPHVCGSLADHDSVIYKDNDFEVFVDPDGDGRWYGEVEVNALGTVFDLLLDKPYIEGGHYFADWSPADLRAGVSIDGTLNDPSDVDRGWSVEIAIPHAALAEHTRAAVPPRPGDVWRLNFSRVQWQHDIIGGRYVKRPDAPEDNWTWTPQGMIDMHRPRRWGFVEFVR